MQPTIYSSDGNRNTKVSLQKVYLSQGIKKNAEILTVSK